MRSAPLPPSAHGPLPIAGSVCAAHGAAGELEGGAGSTGEAVFGGRGGGGWGEGSGGGGGRAGQAGHENTNRTNRHPGPSTPKYRFWTKGTEKKEPPPTLPRTPQVLYNLFDWPTRPDARITVVGIANTMDLPERLLPRIVSRMGLKRCTFRPYTRPQIVAILEHRLEGVAPADANAIKKVAMKVASVSGDVRRALELCRRAAELAEARLAAPGGGEGEEAVMIQMGDVDGAIKEMFDSVHFKVTGGRWRLGGGVVVS